MRWNILESTIPQSENELRNILIKTRGLEKKDELFFSPLNPTKISIQEVGLDAGQLKKAVKRILKAIEKKEKVVIFGDYDADGVCATAILWQALYKMGCQVIPFIPLREKHGYGLSDKALDDLLAKDKPDLIITVDNGIVAHKSAQRVLDAGIDLIITDHHQPEDKLPSAVAVVHSTQLCGATVSWMFAREISKSAGYKIAKDWQLDLTAIATIADQVPLRDANRSFAKFGLEALRKSKRVGFKALLTHAGLNQNNIDSQSVGFGIAPRINAMGRLGHSLDALRLLLTNNKSKAEQLAQVLSETNIARQDMTYEMYGHALSQSENWKQEHIIIVHCDKYHEGVVGLIAGRLMEQFYKPVIVISVGDGIGKASARSVPGVNIVELIREVRDDLLDVGGHPMAAGFGLEASKLDRVITRLKKLAKETIDKELLKPSINVEVVIPFLLINEKTVKMINEFAPFGQGNEEPILGFKNVEVLQVFTMGADNQHLKIVGKGDDGVTPINFLFWRKGSLREKITLGDKIDVAGVLELNKWNGKKSMQIRVKDVKLNV
ncbi:single-stranded-DNA-specific exonuclease RecJ [Patescibacteria group bacterium]|nr:single-stranded-DNA-specific exonuclease RecJ [Patescibacteria group bacterium]MBU1966785.1 single-stranded-DNA-specific exonuclease RecJ [Patescibacteria group bacterium]